MELSKDLCKLVATIECLIGDSCYNPNSYDGWKDKSGKSYSYPVTYTLPDGTVDKTKWDTSGLLDKLSEKEAISFIQRLRYKFGSNHLYIGSAIIDVLEFLEDRYDLDFNELEKNIGKEK